MRVGEEGCVLGLDSSKTVSVSVLSSRYHFFLVWVPQSVCEVGCCVGSFLSRYFLSLDCCFSPSGEMEDGT